MGDNKQQFIVTCQKVQTHTHTHIYTLIHSKNCITLANKKSKWKTSQRAENERGKQLRQHQLLANSARSFPRYISTSLSLLLSHSLSRFLPPRNAINFVISHKFSSRHLVSSPYILCIVHICIWNHVLKCRSFLNIFSCATFLRHWRKWTENGCWVGLPLLALLVNKHINCFSCSYFPAYFVSKCQLGWLHRMHR